MFSKFVKSLLACSVATTALTAASLASAKDMVALLLPENVNPRWETQNAAAFASTMGELVSDVKVEVFNANNDTSTPQRQAEQSLTQGAKVLVVIPIDGKRSAIIADTAAEEYVPTIADDRMINSKSTTFWVQADLEGMGYDRQRVEVGATLLAGGDRPAHLNKGHDIAPTVLSNVVETMQVYRQETFGPIVSLVQFEDERDLLRMANDCGAGGLTAYVFTRDPVRAAHCASRLRYGEIQINGVKYDIDLPHGGIGQAGIGHDRSALALHNYLVLKRVTQAVRSDDFEGLNT